MTSDQGECPGCTTPSPRSITSDDQKKIPPPAWRKIDSAPGRALICNYCGCVYKVNTPPSVFGYLNNPLRGKGWVAQPSSIPT